MPSHCIALVVSQKTSPILLAQLAELGIEGRRLSLWDTADVASEVYSCDLVITDLFVGSRVPLEGIMAVASPRRAARDEAAAKAFLHALSCGEVGFVFNPNDAKQCRAAIERVLQTTIVGAKPTGFRRFRAVA